MQIPKNTTVCAVTKGRTIKEVETILEKYPQIKIIAENRWPDCEEKFLHFKNLEKHFIGPLQSNKVKKVVAAADVIQSVDSEKLLSKINETAFKLEKKIGFLIQVNISNDKNKSGVLESEVNHFVEYYLNLKLENVKLLGLMTIGEQSELQKRAEYFAKLKKIFDEVNKKYFKKNPLKILSMGMSDDYEIAIKEGATMVRIGSALFKN